MKFFNLYKNQFKYVCKSSRIQLYNKYYKFKKKNFKSNDNSDTIDNEFINYITKRKKIKCRKLYHHNYYMKNRKKASLNISIKNNNNNNKIEERNNGKLYRYYMNKEKVLPEKKRKKKESLSLEWDFQNPCEK